MNIGDEHNYFIEFRHEPYLPENSIISIAKTKPESDKYYFNDNKLGSINNFRFKVALSSKVFLFLSSLSDFEKVAATSLDDIYNQFKSNIQTEDLNKRKPYLFFYESKKNKLENDTKFIYQSGKAQDYIIAYPSFGMQMINSTFAPEITINVDFAFGMKGTVGQKFGFSTTFLYMPDKDDFLNVNTYNFVNANYYFKINNKWTHKISIGYMFDKNGSDFSYNTWNGFWQSNIKSFGLKLGGLYTKNSNENYVVIPSIGFDFGF
ncbi:MAG: hypothetical protein HC831_32165 [Chloroflexia bacterium]|nr:hypothetical protein [Chloroflexia bacterium]